MKRLVLGSLFFGVAAGCGGGRSLPTGPTPVTAAVELRYVVAKARDSSSSALPCAGQVSAHPSWWGFSQVTMAPLASDTWAVLFDEVPVGRHSVRIRAPEGCGAYELFANGAPVTAEDGTLGFTVHADGSVTP
ncbi:MAG: hypothetical protein ACRD21_12740 [Vicinamibacteria bacterium]